MLTLTNAQFSRSPRELGAEAVDVVVVAADLDEVRAVDAGREDLLLLEVGRDEDVGLASRARRAWAATALARLPVEAQASVVEAELAGARRRRRETTRSLNECVGLAASFLTHTSPRPSRSASRSARISGVQPAGRPTREDARAAGPAGRRQRQEVGVAPDVLRAALDAAPQLARRRSVGACGRRRPRAGRSTARRRSAPRARTPSRILDTSAAGCHVKTSAVGLRGGGSGSLRHISQELAPSRLLRGLPGLHRASPSTPLDVSSYVGGSISGMPSAVPGSHAGRGDPMTDEPRSPHAEPAQAPPARTARARAAVAPPRLSLETPQRRDRRGRRPALDQHRAPAPDRPRLARGALRLPPARLRGRLLAQPAPEGRRVRRLPVRRPALPALRQARRPPERRRARHLRRARTTSSRCPTSRSSRSSTCSSAAARARSVREQLFAKGPGYLLYKIVDDCVDASFPMLRKMGNKLERLEEDIFEGRSSEIVRDISNVKQEIINFRKIVRPQRAALRDLERTQALHPRGPRHLLRRHQRRVRAHLGHARELQGGRRGRSRRPTSRSSRTAQRRPAGR